MLKEFRNWFDALTLSNTMIFLLDIIVFILSIMLLRYIILHKKKRVEQEHQEKELKFEQELDEKLKNQRNFHNI